jgi:hypothetical protein
MNYKTREELMDVCKTRNLKGYSGKPKNALIQLLAQHTESAESAQLTKSAQPAQPTESAQPAEPETHAFVYQTMLTCIGNKRKLVKNIRNIV